MPFPQALAWSEIQSTLSGIWTWINRSISYNYTHNVKHTSSIDFVTKYEVFKRIVKIIIWYNMWLETIIIKLT